VTGVTGRWRWRRRFAGVERRDGARERGLDIVRGLIKYSVPIGAVFMLIGSRGIFELELDDGKWNVSLPSK
jgi:hypothetical protein